MKTPKITLRTLPTASLVTLGLLFSATAAPLPRRAVP